MTNLLTNLRQILISFRFSPKKALSNSYQLANANETSGIIIFLLALMAGLGNILGTKFVPIKAAKDVDNALDKYGMGGIGDSFKNAYKPELTKYFLLGVLLFCIAFIICTIVSYAVRTNLFKTSENFFMILKITSLQLVPAIILFFIAGVASCLSLILYLFFLILSLCAFAIYFFEHLVNISQKSKDAVCFISSVSVLVILFIIFKVNVNSDILGSFGSFFYKGFDGLLN